MPACEIDRHQLAAEIKRVARQLGFDLVGIAPASAIQTHEYFRNWLRDGKAGSMAYLERRIEERVDPSVYFPGARSVICVAINYNNECESAADPGIGKIARYARGSDYHELIKERLYQLADWLRKAAPEAQTKCGVDTAPIMEKPLAARAGIGWQGKNTCIIHPAVGSWLLLGEVITTIDLPFDQPMADHCGTCRRCIDACPTGALTEPYQLDARRCISYLTIENTGEIPAEFKSAIGERLFGCDICQDVCPYNRGAPLSEEPAFLSRFESGGLSTDAVMNWSHEDYAATLRHSAMKRVKLPVLQRNARIVQENFERGK